MIAERIKQAREAAGHSQTSLAEVMSITHQQIWRWESGKITPEAPKIALLAKTLNVSADYLLGLTDTPTRQTRESDFSQHEIDIIMALRRGDKMEAVKAIVNE